MDKQRTARQLQSRHQQGPKLDPVISSRVAYLWGEAWREVAATLVAALLVLAFVVVCYAYIFPLVSR